MALNFDPYNENKMEGEYTPIPEGRYNFQIVNAELKESRQGNPALKITFRIKGSGKLDGRKCFSTLSLMPSARWALQEFLVAAGNKTATSGGTLDEVQMVKELLKNQPVVNAYTEPEGNVDKIGGYKPLEHAGATTGSSDLPEFDKDIF